MDGISKTIFVYKPHSQLGLSMQVSVTLQVTTMAEISISIDIKYFGDDNTIIATFNIIPCIN